MNSGDAKLALWFCAITVISFVCYLFAILVGLQINSIITRAFFATYLVGAAFVFFGTSFCIIFWDECDEKVSLPNDTKGIASLFMVAVVLFAGHFFGNPREQGFLLGVSLVVSGWTFLLFFLVYWSTILNKLKKTKVIPTKR